MSREDHYHLPDNCYAEVRTVVGGHRQASTALYTDTASNTLPLLAEDEQAVLREVTLRASAFLAAADRQALQFEVSDILRINRSSSEKKNTSGSQNRPLLSAAAAADGMIVAATSDADPVDESASSSFTPEVAVTRLLDALWYCRYRTKHEARKEELRKREQAALALSVSSAASSKASAAVKVQLQQQQGRNGATAAGTNSATNGLVAVRRVPSDEGADPFPANATSFDLADHDSLHQQQQQQQQAPSRVHIGSQLGDTRGGGGGGFVPKAMGGDSSSSAASAAALLVFPVDPNFTRAKNTASGGSTEGLRGGAAAGELGGRVGSSSRSFGSPPGLDSSIVTAIGRNDTMSTVEMLSAESTLRGGGGPPSSNSKRDLQQRPYDGNGDEEDDRVTSPPPPPLRASATALFDPPPPNPTSANATSNDASSPPQPLSTFAAVVARSSPPPPASLSTAAFPLRSSFAKVPKRFASKHNPLEPEPTAAAAAAAESSLVTPTNVTLRSLDLTELKVFMGSNEQLACVIQLCSLCPNVEVLSLAGHHCSTWVFEEALLPLLASQHPSLRSVGLQGNAIEASVAKKLIVAVQNNCRLTDVQVDPRCGLLPTTAKRLAEAVELNRKKMRTVSKIRSEWTQTTLLPKGLPSDIAQFLSSTPDHHHL